MKPEYRLGLTQHLLFADGMSDPAYHERTLLDALSWSEVEVMDLQCQGDAAQMAREAAAIKSSGKIPVYNTPLLYLEPGCDPNSTDPAVVERTRAVALTHLDTARDCGSRLQNIASGVNPSVEDRDEAWRGWIDFITWFGREAGERGIHVVMEPFDQSIGKNLLIGPTRDAVRSVEETRSRGVVNVGIMVDMGHLPLIGEQFDEALDIAQPYLWHVHLGSAVMRDPSHPLYGDNHPPMGIPEGEHGIEHLIDFLKELVRVGYFEQESVVGGSPTLTLEMRPYPDTSERESIAQAMVMLDEAWQSVA
jgi:sugar phosphate isomerase/epimerase